MTEEVNPFAGLPKAEAGTAQPSEVTQESQEDDRSANGHPFARRGANPVPLANLSVDLGRLREYNWGEQPWEEQTLDVRVRDEGEGRWRTELSWNPVTLPGASVAVYRVLIGEGDTPDPQCADIEGTLLLTTECSAVDALWLNVPEAAVRHYAVWCYLGASLGEALRSSPYPVASGHVVLPVTGISHSVDYGQVVLSWDGWEDPLRTIRVIKQDPRSARREGIPSPHTGEVAHGGQFVDESVEPGGDYLYTLFAGAEVDGRQEWSNVSRRHVKVPAEVKPVLDLEVFPSGDGTTVDISWTRVPGAEVRVYRSPRQPALAAHQLGPVNIAELQERVNLREEDLLPHRPAYESDKGWIRHVPIPPDCSELHFTPVTTVGESCVPGKTVNWLSLRPPQEPLIEDRVEWLLVVFEWPMGAKDVLLYVSDLGQRIIPAERQPLQRISQDDHRIFGGFRVDRALLKAGTFDIHLCSYGSLGGEHYSEATTVTHTFPILVRYQIRTEPKFRGRKTLLDVWADEEVRDAELRLVWHPTFLPMSAADSARTLIQKTLNLRGHQAVSFDLSGLGVDLPSDGFVRLISRPRQPIAVIDPEISQLRRGGA